MLGSLIILPGPQCVAHSKAQVAMPCQRTWLRRCLAACLSWLAACDRSSHIQRWLAQMRATPTGGEMLWCLTHAKDHMDD